MRTRVVRITRHMPEWGAVEAAASVINSGGVVCFPTDTIYGFAASIYSRDAIARLKRIKARPACEPFVVLAADMGWVKELTIGLTARHRRLIDLYWPGPLTVVFRASPAVPAYIAGHDGTIAIRVPNDALTQSILRASGMPLAAPSANLRGVPPALSVCDVLKHFGGKIDMLLDGGALESPEPSTIVAVKRRGFAVLRQGRTALGRV